ncbi:MAG TPA: CHC2 zinc finger domain-containing protein [Methanosarcina sp.]|nr:CHC2 zinc finger domain-containing protein [Methanosarcina sp.]
MSKLDNFLSRLQKVRKTGGNSWLACCPAHGDKNPSMTISEGSDGRVLVHCFSHQCGIDEITGAVGLEIKDLMPDNIGFHRVKPLRMQVNPRDALYAVRDDMTEALVYMKRLQRNEQISMDDSLRFSRIVGRLQMAIELTGDY